MFKIEIVTDSKSSKLYDELWKSISDVIANYREDHDPELNTTITGNFNPNK